MANYPRRPQQLKSRRAGFAAWGWVAAAAAILLAVQICHIYIVYGVFICISSYCPTFCV